MTQNNDIASASAFDNLLVQASGLIEQARSTAYRQVNEILVKRNWLLGKLIAEEELKGDNRAAYGKKIIKSLSIRLTGLYGKGFTKRDLYNYVVFFKQYSFLFKTLDGIVYSASTQSYQLLSWTHYRTLIQELNAEARAWYEREAAEQNWSVRTLQRNISSQYYFRTLASQHKDLVRQEMMELTAPLQDSDPLEFIKNPVIGEFLGFTADSSPHNLKPYNLITSNHAIVCARKTLFDVLKNIQLIIYFIKFAPEIICSDYSRTQKLR